MPRSKPPYPAEFREQLVELSPQRPASATPHAPAAVAAWSAGQGGVHGDDGRRAPAAVRSRRVTQSAGASASRPVLTK